jgi:Ca-activated chloride channel homolog
MKFAHPWFLLVSFGPIVWCIYSLLRSSRPLSAALKALSMAAILVALAEPSLTLPETKAAKVILIDTSASVSSQELARACSMAQRAEDKKGRNWAKIIPFDSMPRRLTPGELTNGLHLERAGSANATNMEAAFSASMAAFPNGYLPGLLLISDGNENEGSTLRAVAQLRRLQIPVDTIPLGSHSNSGLHLEGISMPHRAFSSELIPIDLTLKASAAGAATIDLSAEGKMLGHQVVRLESGTNVVRVDARIKSLGVVALSGIIRSAQLGESTFQQAIELRRAQALYLSEDPAGTDANLLAALGQTNVEIERDAGQLDRDLYGFQLLILNNLDLATVSPARKTKIENYVKNGGGLLLIGGEKQVYKENKQMDALDRALPAKLAPPEAPKGTCVALIIDKSSSMEGRKIELARLSAIGVVDHLHPNDTIGVLIFDNSFQWAVPMRRAEDKSLIKRLISGITPDGGTQIAPALAEAYRRVIPSAANFKHIVLLTDGISEEGDSLELAKEAAQHAVTISTVGLGQDVNRSYLEKVAATSGGRSYFLNEPVGLEQILLKDVETYSGTTAVERALTPIIASKADVLEGTGMENAPPLRGYARYKAKDGAQALLQMNSIRKDPLFVRWQYGLGRAAVFASDAKSRWAEAWINWPGFDKFWTNVTRDLLMRTSPSEATVNFDEANGDLVVHYRVSSQVTEPATIPQIFALGPNGFRMPVNVRKTADGMYEGRVRIGSQTGLFRVRPVDESVAFPEAGFYRQEPEFEETGANDNLLRMISSFTNGRFNPRISEIFNSNGRSNPVQWQLWPAFLALAIGLTIAELIARKWSGLSTHFTWIRLRGA